MWANPLKKPRCDGFPVIVGINCNAFLPHDEMNQKLQTGHGNVELAHYGLSVGYKDGSIEVLFATEIMSN